MSHAGWKPAEPGFTIRGVALEDQHRVSLAEQRAAYARKKLDEIRATDAGELRVEQRRLKAHIHFMAEEIAELKRKLGVATLESERYRKLWLAARKETK